MGNRIRVAFVSGVGPGTGGLAVQTANAIAALARPGVELHVIAPSLTSWPRSDSAPAVRWHALAPPRPVWRHWPMLRRAQGHAQWTHDIALGRAAADRVARIDPHLVYAFTQVALESLSWARERRVASVLESPNGHLSNFRRVYVEESRRWCNRAYLGHPTPAMVTRVEREYEQADRIRVSSEWSRDSLVRRGISEAKIGVLQQPVDLAAFTPAPDWPEPEGPLRVVFTGTLDLRKGFVYLLEAAARVPHALSIELVGGTVDSCTKRLLQAARTGQDVRTAPGDPRPAFRRAELAVLPTLEDGSPFAAAEAMASGLPLIVTDCCGAAEWVEPGVTGWVVPGRDVDALAVALEDAIRRRGNLRRMGLNARDATERRAAALVCDRLAGEWALRSC